MSTETELDALQTQLPALRGFAAAVLRWGAAAFGDWLRPIVRDAVREAVRDLPAAAPQGDVVDRRGLAALLCKPDASESTVSAWIRSGTVPPPSLLGIGGKDLWLVADVLAHARERQEAKGDRRPRKRRVFPERLKSKSSATPAASPPPHATAAFRAIALKKKGSTR